MLNRMFSEKLIPRQIIDGCYTGAELGPGSITFQPDNRATSNNSKINNNSTVLNESKTIIIKYMELRDLISEKESELNELYKEQKEMESELLTNPVMCDLLHKLNENVSKRTLNKLKLNFQKNL